MSIITVGIDLAKNVFAVHGVDDNGKAALVKPKVSRDKLLELVAQLPPCVIGMEACSGAHHWARLFRQHGHTVKLMAPKFVTPYRMSGKRGKNDAADAAAICEAVTRPNMRFVPVKEEHQQIILCLHRTRNGFVEERTATYNRLRGLISEFGIVLPQKVACLRREHRRASRRPARLRQPVRRRSAGARRSARCPDCRVRPRHRQAAKEDARSKRLMQLPGIGPITASALLASIGGGHDFKNGRQVAAWIGLTPGPIQQRRQSPTGADHQGRRPLPAQPAGHGGTRHPQWSGRQAGSLQSLGAQPAGTARLLEGGGRHCREECPAGLGGVEVRRGVPTEAERGLNRRSNASARKGTKGTQVPPQERWPGITDALHALM